MLGTVGLAGAFSFFSNKILSCGEGGLLATHDDEVAEFARSRRSHAMTSGTWDRHRGHSLGYDVVGLGYNYRLDEPRAALLSARLPGLAADIEARRAVTRRYRELLADEDELVLPYSDEEVGRSSCYVMPVMLRNPELRDPLRTMLAEQARRPDDRPLPVDLAVQRVRRTGGLAAALRARRRHAADAAALPAPRRRAPGPGGRGAAAVARRARRALSPRAWPPHRYTSSRSRRPARRAAPSTRTSTSCTGSPSAARASSCSRTSPRSPRAPGCRCARSTSGRSCRGARS